MFKIHSPETTRRSHEEILATLETISGAMQAAQHFADGTRARRTIETRLVVHLLQLLRDPLDAAIADFRTLT
jgi:hypothetical protein